MRGDPASVHLRGFWYLIQLLLIMSLLVKQRALLSFDLLKPWFVHENTGHGFSEIFRMFSVLCPWRWIGVFFWPLWSYSLSWGSVNLSVSSSSAHPTLQIFLFLFSSCSFFFSFCQGQCVFRLEGVAQYSLSLRPAMMIPLRKCPEQLCTTPLKDLTVSSSSW